MIRRLILLPVLAGMCFAATVGCGASSSKMADVPSEEAIRADKAAQKAVAAEERGTPIKGGRSNRR